MKALQPQQTPLRIPFKLISSFFIPLPFLSCFFYPSPHKCTLVSSCFHFTPTIQHLCKLLLHISFGLLTQKHSYIIYNFSHNSTNTFTQPWSFFSFSFYFFFSNPTTRKRKRKFSIFWGYFVVVIVDDYVAVLYDVVCWNPMPNP